LVAIAFIFTVQILQNSTKRFVSQRRLKGGIAMFAMQDVHMLPVGEFALKFGESPHSMQPQMVSRLNIEKGQDRLRSMELSNRRIDGESVEEVLNLARQINDYNM
jgi:hypothetical protein